FLRAYGSFGQPNPFAGYLGTVLPLLLAQGLGRPGARRQPYWFLGLLSAAGLLILAAVGMSLSRGAWIGVAGGLALVAALHSRAGRLLLALTLLLALVIGLAGALGALPPAILTRLE